MLTGKRAEVKRLKGGSNDSQNNHYQNFKSKFFSHVAVLLFSDSLIFYLPTLTELLSLPQSVHIHTFKIKKQFPKTSEAKFKKITLYYTNISFCRIRVLGLFVVDVAMGAASQWQSEASL